MNWEGFEKAAPELALLGRGRFESTGMAMLGTIRADGSPRISPCEVFIVDGELLLGMMWQSKKALDLVRDPRLAVHSTTCDRAGTEGDFKLYGRVVDVTDAHLRERYAETLQETIDWRPEEPYHLFRADIERAGFIVFGPEQRALRWTQTDGLARIPHPNDL